MKPAVRIILAIVITLAVNILCIVAVSFFRALTLPECESQVNAAYYSRQWGLIMLVWLVVQLLVILVLLFRTPYKGAFLASLIAWLLSALLLFTSIRKGFDFSYPAYDAAEWKKGTLRMHFAQGIIARGDLQGKCEEELLEILGEPNIRADHTWQYDMLFGVFIVELDNGCHTQAHIECW